MGVVYLIVIGAAAGFLATRLMKIEAGLLPTVAIGIAGALLGGFLLELVLTAMGFLGGLVGAVLGALVLIWLWQRFGPRG
ncbi:GlsB/YeaQ/YmgE family stress response membrane protein [Roseovarius sp. E0-M6]|uniref:GlsB/YeaQ/YmgE family stress response membrane protein n=1 Tax=Roseovarius sp. E0-M6 TaxID=3127118 RepID=UPI00300FB965